MIRSRGPAPGAAGVFHQHLDEDLRGRPFAGVVDQIAGHLLEILAFAAKPGLRIGLDLDGDAAVAMDLLHGPAQRLDRRARLR